VISDKNMSDILITNVIIKGNHQENSMQYVTNFAARHQPACVTDALPPGLPLNRPTLCTTNPDAVEPAFGFFSADTSTSTSLFTQLKQGNATP
jgi:hypothetical protein